MPGPASLMREIHRLRRFARDLQEQTDRLPRQSKAHQAKVARQEELLRQEQDAIKKLKVAGHEKEISLKTAHAQIAKYEQQRNEAASKKEYDALQAEIAGVRAKCQQLEDEILAGMAEGEERAARLPEREQAVKLAREEAAAFEKGAAERQASLAAQLAETQAKLAEVEAGIPAPVRAQYNRLVAAMGADALAAAAHGTCSACHTGITAQQATDLQREAFVPCKSCGRILYLPE
jgi:predicted  nucleic acid-binding Zn-ribbon protein